jgi:hypothetical protein
MKRFATLFVALGLATAGSTVVAEEAKDQVSKQDAKPQPVQMTDAQLDTVAAGILVVLNDVVEIGDVTIPVRILNNSVNDNQINVQVPVGAGVGILGAGGGVAGAFGRQTR